MQPGPAEPAPLYDFGDFRLDPGRRLVLRRDGTPVPLTPKAYDTLVYLCARAGQIVEKDELMRALWPGVAVEENNLTQNVSVLRRALGEGRGDHAYVATVPGRGYQFVAAVREASARKPELKPPPGDHRISIAVLPLMNASAQPEYDYFADGLAEDLINALSRLPGLRVAARTSAFSFKGSKAHAPEIAAQLGVTLILEGSLRIAGHRLRITAQLIDASEGYQIWSERYDREINPEDMFAVQDELTQAVIQTLQLRLPGQLPGEPPPRGPATFEAHQLCLKGRFQLFRMTRDGIDAGVRYFTRAIECDPLYAPAHVGLAHAYRMGGLSLDQPPAEAGPKAREAAQAAVRLDANLAEAQAVLGFVTFWYEWDWAAADRHFQRALRLNAHSPDTQWMYAHLQSNLSNHGVALATVAQARQLDPLSGLIHAMEGQFLLHAGRADDALVRLREAVELDPQSRVAHLFSASAYIETRQYAEAAAEARIAQSLTPENTQGLALEAVANAALGLRAEAREALRKLLEMSSQRHVPPYNVALILRGLDEHEQALSWLERALEQRDPKMVFLGVEPQWKKLRADKRFAGLLRHMSL